MNKDAGLYVDTCSRRSPISRQIRPGTTLRDSQGSPGSATRRAKPGDNLRGEPPFAAGRKGCRSVRSPGAPLPVSAMSSDTTTTIPIRPCCGKPAARICRLSRLHSRASVQRLPPRATDNKPRERPQRLRLCSRYDNATIWRTAREDRRCVDVACRGSCSAPRLPAAASITVPPRRPAAQSRPPPVTFTAGQDHSNMMEQLGIQAVRPAPAAMRTTRIMPTTMSCWPIRTRLLPDPLRLEDGVKVTTRGHVVAPAAAADRLGPGE